MNVKLDQKMVFTVLIPENLNNYSQVDARAVFHQQPTYTNGPSATPPTFPAAVNNPVTFTTKQPQQWRRVKSGATWGAPPNSFSNFTFDTTAGMERVINFEYDASLYPTNSEGILEVMLTKGTTRDILTFPITVFETNAATKNCVVSVKITFEDGVVAENSAVAGNWPCPRVNTWRATDGGLFLIQPNTEFPVQKEIPLNPDRSIYGVDIFFFKAADPGLNRFVQEAVISRSPAVDVISSFSGETIPVDQQKLQLQFTTSASVNVTIRNRRVGTGSSGYTLSSTSSQSASGSQNENTENIESVFSTPSQQSIRVTGSELGLNGRYFRNGEFAGKDIWSHESGAAYVVDDGHYFESARAFYWNGERWEFDGGQIFYMSAPGESPNTPAGVIEWVPQFEMWNDIPLTSITVGMRPKSTVSGVSISQLGFAGAYYENGTFNGEAVWVLEGQTNSPGFYFILDENPESVTVGDGWWEFRHNGQVLWRSNSFANLAAANTEWTPQKAEYFGVTLNGDIQVVTSIP